MLIDFHTHIFPERIAYSALLRLSKCAGGIKPFYDGTKTGLLEYMRQNGIDYSVVLNIATNPAQQKSVNDFAAALNGDNLFAFGSIHPDAPDANDEIDRICDLGLKGVKFHPDYQKFEGDDIRVFPLYEKIAKRGLIAVFHAGVDIGLYPPVYMTPKRMAKALKPLEGAKVVAAHFGGYMMWEEVLNELCGRDVYLDTSYSVSKIPPNLAARIINEHGANRILFGSDLPWSNASEEVDLINTLALAPEDKQNIFYQNAKELLNLK